MFNLIPLPYRIIGGLLIVAVVILGSYATGYQDGGDKCRSDWDKENAKAASAVQQAQEKIGENNDANVTQYVDRWNTIKEKEYVYVDTAKSRVPNQRDMSNGWVYLHDQAAKADNADPALASDEASSGIKDNQALAVVVSNYSQCLQDKNQLIALQAWITDTKKTVDEANSESSK